MSWQMRAVGIFTRLTRKRRYAAEDGGPALLERTKGPSVPPAKVLGDLTVSSWEVRQEVSTGSTNEGAGDSTGSTNEGTGVSTGSTNDGTGVSTGSTNEGAGDSTGSTNDALGFTVYDVARPEVAADPESPVVLYLHGGAFVNEIVKQQWELAADLARAVDAVVRVPIYGLAPDHHAREAVALVATLLGRIEEEGRASYLLGDSAGGNLALVGAQQARGTVTGLRGVTVMAPWLDLTMANPEIAAVEPHDPWLARAALHHVAEVWADGTPLTDPTISPLLGTFDGLPPVDVWVGTRDITLPDTRLLRDALAEHGDVTYHEEPGAIHVYPLLPVPEGRRARTTMIELVRRQLP